MNQTYEIWSLCLERWCFYCSLWLKVISTINSYEKSFDKKQSFNKLCVALGAPMIIFFCIFAVPVKSPEPMEPLTEIPDEAPTVTSEPQNLIVDEGEPATFTCKIKGSPGMLRLSRCEK